MTETLVELVRTTFEHRSQKAVHSCPECGSFLDAPRVNPSTGELGRKCVACRDWLPLTADPVEYVEYE